MANNPTTWTDPTGAFVAGNYVNIARATTGAVITTAPPIAFSIVKPLALTGAVIGTAIVARTVVGPDEDAATDTDDVPAPQPFPVPLPLPLPLGESINKPRPEDCTINGATWINYWGPSSKPMGADACLRAPLSAGSGPGYYPPGTPNTGYDRGHIIARRLGGSGTAPGNLFAQCRGANRGKMRVFEGEVATAVDSGETVYYVVALGYFGRTIPDTVSVFFAGSQGAAGAAVFSNVC